MDVTLTPELEHLIQDKVASGLRQLDLGESVPLDAERIKAEGRRRLARRGVTTPTV